MAKIRVDSYEQMKATADQLRAISENYSSISAQLLDRAGTMGAAWEGEDNLAFVARINGFAEELNLMAKKVMLCSETLDAQWRNYKVTQENNISQVNKLKN